LLFKIQEPFQKYYFFIYNNVRFIIINNLFSGTIITKKDFNRITQIDSEPVLILICNLKPTQAKLDVKIFNLK